MKRACACLDGCHDIECCCSARDAGVDAQRLEAMAPDAKRPKVGTDDNGGKKKT